MVADGGALVAAALQGFIARLFTWRAVSIAALPGAAVLPAGPGSSALGVTLVFLVARQGACVRATVTLLLNHDLAWRAGSFVAFLRAPMFTTVMLLPAGPKTGLHGVRTLHISLVRSAGTGPHA